MFGDPVKNPMHWETRSLGLLLEEIKRAEHSRHGQAVPGKDGQTVPRKVADEEFHRGRCRHCRDHNPQQDMRPAEHGDHGSAGLVAFVNSCCGQGHESEQEAELGGAGRWEAGKITADNGRH